MSHFLIKFLHFVKTVSFSNTFVTFFSKKLDAFFNKLLSHFVIKYLSHFVIIAVAFCDKVSQWTKYETTTIIAFAFNAKSFLIACLVFVFFFILVTFSGRTVESFTITYQESVWPRSDLFLGHTKNSFRKNCSSSYYSWRLWHMTLLMHG